MECCTTKAIKPIYKNLPFTWLLHDDTTLITY